MSKCKVTALANQKGGTEKTTTAANLGVGLANEGKPAPLGSAFTAMTGMVRRQRRMEHLRGR